MTTAIEIKHKTVEGFYCFGRVVGIINVAFLDDLLNLCKVLRSKDTSKWDAAMQKKYDLFMANIMSL